jgi:hypothetical protein
MRFILQQIRTRLVDRNMSPGRRDRLSPTTPARPPQTDQIRRPRLSDKDSTFFCFSFSITATFSDNEGAYVFFQKNKELRFGADRGSPIQRF